MRIAKIARRPEGYWRARYAADPSAADLPHDAQRAWLFADFFGPVDTWERHLRAAGHDAHDVLCGIGPLDRAWLAERGGGEPDAALFLRRVRELSPEVVILEAIQSWTADEIQAFRGIPGVRAVVGVTGTDIRHLRQLRLVDAVMTCMPDLVDDLRAGGGRAVLLPWWFDRRVLDALPEPRTVDAELTFVGSLDPGPHMHDERLSLLRAVARAVPIRVHSNLVADPAAVAARFAATSAAYWAARTMRAVGVPEGRLPAPLAKAARWHRPPAFLYDRALFRQVRPSGFGLSMYRLLRAGRATLNMHVALAGPYAANMRLFEATGAGVCLLTDAKRNLSDFFADGEVVVYDGVEDAAEKARWLRDNPRDADAVAARGQARTLASHGFESRVPIVEEAIRLALSRAGG
jgi:hypothetical protein